MIINYLVVLCVSTFTFNYYHYISRFTLFVYFVLLFCRIIEFLLIKKNHKPIGI